MDSGPPRILGSATLPLRGTRQRRVGLPGAGRAGARGTGVRGTGVRGTRVRRAGVRGTRVRRAGGAWPGWGGELDPAEHLIAQVGGDGQGRDGGQEGKRAGQAAAGGAADLAGVDVPGDPFADEGGEAAVPAGQDLGEVRAVLAAQAGDQERPEGAFDLVTEAAEEDVGVAGLDAHGLAELGALEAVAQVQVE